MIKTDFLDTTKEIKPINVFFINKENSNLDEIPNEFTGLLCKYIAEADRGLGGGGATWYYVLPIYKSNGTISYPKGKEKRKAIYKSEDLDYLEGVFNEKKWSILGKAILPSACRVPDIDVTVSNEEIKKSNGFFPGRGVLSYNVLQEDEELIHITEVLKSRFPEREYKNFLYIQELLDGIRFAITDKEEYLKIEEAIIKTILLDAKTNNGDRNCDNWALIRNTKTGKYSLGLFDHCSALNAKFNNTNFKSFITSRTLNGSLEIETNDKIVEYIRKNFPQYFEEFEETYNEKIEKLKIDSVKSRNIE